MDKALNNQILETIDTMQDLSINIRGFHSLLRIVREADAPLSGEAIDFLCNAVKGISETFNSTLETLDTVRAEVCK